MQNLEQEEVDGRDGRTHACAPTGITSLLAHRDAGLRWSLGRPIHVDALKHGGDTGDHPCTSCLRV